MVARTPFAAQGLPAYPGRMRDALHRHAGYLVIVLLNLIALGLTAWTLRDRRAGAVRIESAPTPAPAPTATAARLSVFVSGAVATPDVVVLPDGARARDAVIAAGGFAPGADRAAVNLAAPLADGQQLHVPAIGEAVPPAAAVAGTGGAALAPGTQVGGLGGGGPAGAASGGMGAGAAAVRLDINRASAAELEALPGIGPALAERIVAYRTTHGPFRAPDGLLDVGGIGAKTLERFAGLITTR